MQADRLNELADHFANLAGRIPAENGASAVWQAEVIAATEECLEPRAGTLSTWAQATVPVTRVAAFKAALQTLYERAGRYSTVHNPEIQGALGEVITVLREMIGAGSQRLRDVEPQVLDFVADCELRNGRATLVVDVQLEFASLDDQTVFRILEKLERRKLVQLGGSNRNEVYLKRLGVLQCGGSARWNELGAKLLSYLRERLLRERGEFKVYTWQELKSAGVGSTDVDRVAIERLIHIFLLSPHSSSAGWHVPSFIVKIRTIQNLQQLDELLVVLWETPQPSPSPVAHQPRFLDDVAKLATVLLALLREHGGDLSTCFEAAEVATLLGWEAPRFNRSMNALASRGWLDLDPRLGSAPFAAHGFEVTEGGLLAFESAAPDRDEQALESHAVNESDRRTVFIIHGRNTAAKNAVEQFVRCLGLNPLDFDQVSSELGGSPFIGEVVRKGLQLAHGIIAVFTPDEFSALDQAFRWDGDKSEDSLRWQSRPNVIFEAGMAFGMSRERTVLVTLGGQVSLFSDVSGIHTVRLDNSVESRKKLRQRLIGMKCAVDTRPDAWTDSTRSGDFEACVARSAVSPRDPFGPVVVPPASPKRSGKTLTKDAEDYMRRLGRAYIKASFPNHKVWRFDSGAETAVHKELLNGFGFIKLMGTRGAAYTLTDQGHAWIMTHKDDLASE